MTSRDGGALVKRRRRLTMMATALAVAVSWPAGAGWGSPASPPGGKATPNDSTVEGRRPAPGDVVNSWALAPSGDDPSQPGTRTDLSYDATAGATIQDNVILFNYSNVPLTFRVYATDAFNNADGGFDLLAGDKKPTDVGTWVTLPQENITLLPGTQATMPIIVKVPAGASPGDHVGAVLASSQAQGTSRDNKVVTLDRRTGTRLYVRVAGPLEPELVVTRLKATYRPALNPLDGGAKVTYRVENRGNVRLGGMQQVSIAAPFGLAKKSKPAVKLPELLPGQGVTLEASFDGVMASGLAVTKVNLDVKPVAKDVGAVPSRSSRSLTAAVPLTAVVMILAAWLLRRARRSYRSHVGGQARVGVAGNV